MRSNFSADDIDQQEALTFRPGQRVELKANPGVVDIIAEYDPMMVPPIWLANDPKPRYPHELNVLPKLVSGMGWLKLPNRKTAKHPVRKSSNPLAIASKH